MRKIHERCGARGAEEYYNSYIQPLVDQSRDIVTTKCEIAPPYDLDFISSAASSVVYIRTTEMLMLAVPIALVNVIHLNVVFIISIVDWLCKGN